jgi:hypothetical protein
VPWTQPIAAAPYSAHARFSKPEVVLTLPEPDASFPFIRATWHYARGVALARLGRSDEARAEVTAISELARCRSVSFGARCNCEKGEGEIMKVWLVLVRPYTLKRNQPKSKLSHR